MVKIAINTDYTANRNSILLIRSVLLTVTLLLSSLGTGLAHAANITVSTSRNPVALDDSFHLTYEADSNVDDEPDFSPVYKDFDVLNSSQSTNMRSINGSWSLKKTWDLTVIAKQVGKFTIPAISFGKDISPAIQVTVSNSTSSNSASPGGSASVPAKIYLESSIDKKSGWVQSQFIYTIRLFRTVRITGAAINDPEADDPDAIIQQISEDSYQTTRGGIRYEVYERRYAIFPQKSGTLKIKPVTFEGRINTTQPRSIFDQFRMSGQLKRLRSKQLTLQIKPAPADINLQDWLPASKLQLVEEWSADIGDVKAGEPITRTITIAAEGLTAIQLPELQFADIDGLKQYPDKPVQEDRKSDTGITGLKQIKVALIPSRAGKFTLPEIRLAWWNTQTNQKEVATLAPIELTVTGTASGSDTTATPAANQSTIVPVEQPAPVDTAVTTSATVSSESAYWKWLSLFFALAWLLTLVLYFRKPGAARATPAGKPHSRTVSLKAASSEVEKAARANDAHTSRDALLSWARAFYQDKHISNLTQITALSSAELAQAIKTLNQTLYGSDASNWQGDELLTAFKAQQKSVRKHSPRPEPALKPLYR